MLTPGASEEREVEPAPQSGTGGHEGRRELPTGCRAGLLHVDQQRNLAVADPPTPVEQGV